MGLVNDPVKGMSLALEKVQKILEKYQSSDPLRLSAALSDGKSIWAFHYCSDHTSPSLFYGTPDVMETILKLVQSVQLLQNHLTII